MSLFRIPAVVGNQRETLRQLSQERKRLWLNTIQMIAGENWRVFSKQFIQGSPSTLLEKITQNLFHHCVLGYASRTGEKCIVGRYRWSQKRKARVLEVPESLMELRFVDCSDVGDGEEVGEWAVLLLVVVVVMSNTLSRWCSHWGQRIRFEREGREVDKGCRLVRLMDISDFEDNEKVKFYTWLSLTQVLLATFNLILPGVNQQKNLPSH